MIHLTQGAIGETALCGAKSTFANPDTIPLRWWNGIRDSMCPECLQLARPEPKGPTADYNFNLQVKG